MKLFSDERNDPKANAQHNLQGRTHYVDDDTLRYFHSRVLSARECTNGLLFAIVTSDAQDANNSKRGFRYVVFDLFGTVIERNPNTVDLPYFKSKVAALSARNAFLKSFDAKAHTLAAIAEARRSFEQKMWELETRVSKMQSARDSMGNRIDGQADMEA